MTCWVINGASNRCRTWGRYLPIPQAGLATTEEKIKTARHEIIEILKATIEGLDYTWSQREGTSEIIAKWMNLKPAQAA